MEVVQFSGENGIGNGQGEPGVVRETTPGIE